MITAKTATSRLFTTHIAARQKLANKRAVLIRLGNVTLGSLAKKVDYSIYIDAFSGFLDLDRPNSDQIKDVSVDIGYFYNDPGDAYCDKFHAVKEGYSE